MTKKQILQEENQELRRQVRKLKSELWVERGIIGDYRFAVNCQRREIARLKEKIDGAKWELEDEG